MKRSPTLLILLLAASVTLAGCAGTTAGQPSTSTTAEAPAQAASSFDSPLAAGSTASVKDATGATFDITFGTVVWDATDAVRAQNNINPAPIAGQKYISVPVTITNTGKLPILNPYIAAFTLDVKLEAGGQEYTAGAVVSLTNGLSTINNLAPGATVTGDVVFSVPTDTTSGVWKAGATYISA